MPDFRGPEPENKTFFCLKNTHQLNAKSDSRSYIWPIGIGSITPSLLSLPGNLSLLKSTYGSVF
jgi:hypothetical protein